MGKPLEMGREENPQDPGYLYCVRCRRQIGLTYSPFATQQALMYDTLLAECGVGECVDPHTPHQRPLVTKDKLPKVAPSPAPTPAPTG